MVPSLSNSKSHQMYRGRRHLFKHILTLVSTINYFPDRTDNFRFLTILSATKMFGQIVKESLRFQPSNGVLTLEANPTNPPSLLLGILLCKIVIYGVAELRYDIMSGRLTMIKLLPPATNRNGSSR